VLPELARAGGSRPVRIWSAPCATGEEPLSIAIALEEAGWFNRLPIEIHASDVSASAIARAVAGRYRERSFRALPTELRARYFVEHDGLSSPVPALRERVTSWSVVNLMAREELLPYATSPIVFCRNAFIYFSPQSVRRVADAFADLMPAPGFLFLGASESLLNVTDRFRLEEIGGAFVYVKRE
jgi:chemotaxis protein methyltransferase CheR